MAKLWLMAALLLFSASAARSVGPQVLATLIKGLMNQYGVNVMFSLAASIPKETYDWNQVIKDNPSDVVKKQVLGGEVYKGNRLVVATVESRVPPREHAEYRVLKDLKLESKPGDLLVLYSYASPCSTKCTKINSNQNIIKEIKKINGQWGEKFFVFTKIFNKDKNLSEEYNVLDALKNLESGIHPRNIFRCDVIDGIFQCISCYDPNQENKLNRFCYSDT